jgi:hypothetical protein
MPPLNLYARVRIFFAHIGARDRGCSVHPGIPCVPPGDRTAPSGFEGEPWQDSGIWGREIAKACPAACLHFAWDGALVGTDQAGE